MISKDWAAVPQPARCGAVSLAARMGEGWFEEPVRDRLVCAGSVCPPVVLTHLSPPTELIGRFVHR